MRSCCITKGAQSGALCWPMSGGERQGKEEGDICIIMAELHCRMAETNITL